MILPYAIPMNSTNIKQLGTRNGGESLLLQQIGKTHFEVLQYNTATKTSKLLYRGKLAVAEDRKASLRPAA